MEERDDPRVRPVTGRLSDSASLPIGPCPHCEREVLGVLLGGEPVRYGCLHCDRPLRRVDWVDESELAGMGYDSWDPLAGGCATGCASGGCGARR